MAEGASSSNTLVEAYTDLGLGEDKKEDEEIEVVIPDSAVPEAILNPRWTFMGTFYSDKPTPRFNPMKQTLAAL